MSSPLIVTGDDNVVPVQLTINRAPFNMSSLEAKARLVSRDHTEAYSGEVTLSESADGADFSTSLVMAEFAPADTASIVFQGRALLAIQVAFPKKKTWYVECRIVKGQIA